MAEERNHKHAKDVHTKACLTLGSTKVQKHTFLAANYLQGCRKYPIDCDMNCFANVLVTFATAAGDVESINNSDNVGMDKIEDVVAAIKRLEDFDVDMNVTTADNDRLFFNIEWSDGIQDDDLFATNDKETADE